MSNLQLLLLLMAALLPAHLQGQVPAADQFNYVNEGEFGHYVTEYGASYRGTPLFESPFQLMWYNTTPGEFYVGLRIGLQSQEPLFRWVWDANRGRPVGENATLSLGRDGNLVLAEADSRAVWSTGTANKGVVGIRILPNGNIVLHDKNGRFLWQSFDYPTDTMMVGQSLYVGGPTKLVSRRSVSDNSEGSYSLVLEKNGLNLYVLPNTASPHPLRYSDGWFTSSWAVSNATFEAEPVSNGAAYTLSLGGRHLARPEYNATISFLRLQVDGNLVAYTYNLFVDSGPTRRTFAYFADDEDGLLPSCELPSKCGYVGSCEDGMCVACPTPGGMLGWSKSCRPPASAAPCKSGLAVNYKKVVGVEHFIPKYNKGLGKLKVGICMSKCTADCSCLGFFYHEESSQCWLAPVLGSLAATTNTSHVVYLKHSGTA